MNARAPVVIATCGSVNIDVTAFCERLPRPGETVAGDRWSIALGGKGANQAVAVARLGARSALVGRVGNDAFGTLARDRLADFGVELGHLATDPAAPTGVAVIDVDRQAENCIVVVGGANLSVAASHVAQARAVLEAARVLLLQLEIPMPASLAAAAMTRAAGGLVILDPAPAPRRGWSDEVLGAVDVVTPNETETEALVGMLPSSQAEAALAARELMDRGALAAIVKMGAHGVFFRDARCEGFVPPFPVTAVNSVGAGDSFNGALAVALAEGNGLPAAVRFAAACGALATTGPGGAGSAPVRAAVERLLAGETSRP